ncbi:MAG: hypothetical protein ACT6QS_02165 [Flavobacteriales bacterium]
MKTFSKPAIGVIFALLIVIGFLSYKIIAKNPQALSSSHADIGTQISSKYLKSKKNPKSEDLYTSKIKYATAVECKKAYNAFVTNLIIEKGPDAGKKPFVDHKVNGWRVNLASIEPLLRRYRQSEITELFLVPIMKPLEDETPAKYEISLMIAAIRTIDDHILIDRTDAEDVLYEYLKPCPDNCPRNLDDVFPAKDKDNQFPFM